MTAKKAPENPWFGGDIARSGLLHMMKNFLSIIGTVVFEMTEIQ